MTRPEAVAVLGAGGTMGLAMARNILGAGIGVRAWNRSPEKAGPLGEDGAVVLDTAAEAVQGADVILTMLSSGDAVLETIEAALSGEPSDEAIWLQMSTIGERDTERCIEFAEGNGLRFVDAPVLGTKQPAEQGELVVLASGPEELQARVAPILNAVGQRTMWVGESGAGSRLKVATNSWLVAIVEGAAETIALAEGMGLDPQLVLDAVSGGPLDLPYLKLKGKAMIERNFEPSFALKLAAKDAGLAVESAERHDVDLPLLTTIRDRFAQGAREHGDEDLSATFLTSAPAKD
ncbi:MAG TPA: NAD(P)-dependent oxidoreductase [Solirubrobacteraceae bacterium]|nr:NAD(P)-dependent oxidoreductase [Solirubrobacteraceae bacterium]